MNRIKVEEHFNEAERLINNAGNNAMDEIEHLLKDRLRKKINVKFM